MNEPIPHFLERAPDNTLAHPEPLKKEQPVTDQYSFWRRRLAGEVVPIHDGECQPGFYRVRNRNKTEWRPVAYWFAQDSALRCRVGRDDIEELRAMELWPYASKHPISHETYKAVVAGGPWPDLHEGAQADRRNSQNAPDDDSFDGLKDRIEDLSRDAEKLVAAGPARTQEEADRASDLANRLGELAKQADRARADEKRPHDEAAKAVQAKWVPVLAAADIYRLVKQKVITPFLTEMERKRQALAEEQRQAASAALQNGADVPPDAAPLPKVKAGSGGRRTVALRTVRDVEITDRAALLTFFTDNPQITATLLSLAEAAVKAGVTVPGVKVNERKVAA